MKKLLFFFMSFFTIVGYGQFFEGFEGAVFPPQDWARFDNGIGTLKQWNTTSSASLVYAGTKAAFMDKENVTDGTTSLDWLVTPQILVPANGQLRFYTKKTQSGIFGSSYTIRVSTTAQTTPSAFTTIKTWTEDDLVATFNVYEQKVIDLSAYANQNVYIAFVLEQDNGDRWLVDQVKVDQRCLVSTNLQATALSTSATLSWTSPNAPVNGPWEIEYGPAGFIPGTGTLVTNVTTNPYVLTGLQSLTNYSYIVRALCEPDNPSPWNEFPTSFQTQALPPECNGNYVDNGGITGNYTNSQDTVITICPTNTGDYVTVAFTQFITEAQYDKMYVYDGQSTAAPLISSGNGGGLGAVTIPGGFWGNLSGNLPGPFEATNATGCLTFRFVSDGVTNAAGWASNITCTPFPTCPKPSNVTSTVVSSSSIIVNWVNNAPSATQWEVIWLPAGSPPPTAGQTGAITNNPSTYTIQGLNSQTTYDIYVRAICQPGTDVGPWSTIKTTGTTQPNYCAGDHFYDLGGPTGNYPNNVTATNGGVTTICPQNPGDVVTVYFNSFNLVSSLGDTLTIYDGNTTTSTQVGTYFGPNVIPSYTSTSPTGCLTFSFVSNGTQNAAGWDATILCGPPCPSITAVLNSVVPAADATNTVKICQGGSVTFTGSGTFAGDSSGATYEWNFDDGTTATGLTATHTFANAGIYLVNLTIIDANGCRNTNRLNQKIYVSTTPLFTGTVAYDDEICEGQSTTITGVAAPVEFIRECAPPVSGTTFLPDGVGVSYLSTVPVDCFPFGTTITSASQITSVCINMEHSYLGDLELRLVSPNGQFIILKNFNGTGGGGGGTYLGCPLDDPAVGPGTGKTYCFTPSATTFLVNGTTSNCGTPNLPSINAGNYMPVNPFTNLIGSQLNGNWSLIVTDNLGVDNGYIFDWSINFDNSILPTDYSFTPVIVSTYWTADPTIVNTTGNTITVTPNVSGTKCYTYNVVDNFGCTYSKEVCIQVTPGVNLTNLNGMPAICTGSNGTFSFEGTPNTTVTYNVNGGANQTVLLDNNGLGTVTLTGLTASATLNATHINAQPIPTSGNAISVVGGVNPSNAVGALQPVGTTATTTNSTTINSNNATVTLTLGNELPPNTNVTVSLTRNNNAGSVTISDGVNSQIFNNTLFPGNLNTLQHINFVTGAFTSTITVTRNNGNTYLDGVYYNYNELGCDKPLLMSQTITVNPAPVITSVVHPASICGGGNASFVVTGTPNAVVTYNINAAADETITLDANGQATITVNAPTANVVLNITLVSLTPCSSTLNSTYTVQYLSSIPVPILTSNSPICANQTATFTLVGTPNAVVTYSLDGATATTVTLDATGNATVSVPNASANVQITLSNIGLNGCNTTLTNTETITVNPNPNVTNLTAVAAQICAGGDAVFTITGVANSVVTYTLNAGASQTVTIGASGTATVTVTNPTANVTLAISGATLGSCSVTVSFSQTVQVKPMPVFTSLASNSPICANQTATFTLVGTPNGIVTYSLNGATATTVTLNATGTATVSVPNVSANVQIVLSSINLNGCLVSLTNTNTITVNPVPVTPTVTPSKTDACIGDDLLFTITGSANAVVTYSLNNGSLQTLTLNASGSGTVSVLAASSTTLLELETTTLGSCSANLTVSSQVVVLPCEIQKGISPNNDGLNDNFQLEAFNVSKLEIFNRYGTKVYSKNNYENEWYGQSNGGQELPDGTYYYVITFTDMDAKTGWIYINREQ